MAALEAEAEESEENEDNADDDEAVDESAISEEDFEVAMMEADEESAPPNMDSEIAADTQAIDAPAEEEGWEAIGDLDIPTTPVDENGALTETAPDDQVATKLDLVQAYIDMGDVDGARDLLGEVLDEGTEAQKAEAHRLMESLTDL